MPCYKDAATHAKLRTKTHRETDTYIHREHWIPLDRQRIQGIWAALVACLSRGPELSIRVLNRGLQRRVSYCGSVREGNGSGQPGSLQPLGTELCQDALLGPVTESKAGREVSHSGSELRPQWLELGRGLVSNKRGLTGNVGSGKEIQAGTVTCSRC